MQFYPQSSAPDFQHLESPARERTPGRRIKAGTMTGVQGILVRKKIDFRIVISLNAIIRRVAVEVDVGDIAPGEHLG
jgi:hypothetical protein